MLVFWKQKLVLLAVPKTGTTALESALLPHASAAILDPPGMKHVSLMRYRNLLAKFFEQRGQYPMETAAVMREPIDWLGSWYRYRRRPQIAGHENSTQDVSFDAFVEAWMEPEPPAFANVGSQVKFLGDARGRCGVTHLFRYDAFGRMVAFLEDRLEVSIDLASRNVSPEMPLTLSPGVEARLRREHADAFALYDGLARNA